jgi:hypothetical protein
MRLLSLVITSAISPAAVTPVYQATSGEPHNLTLQAAFTYGSGGISVDVYVQTSFDGGTTWVDIANFHFDHSTASGIYNLTRATSVTSQVTPTDGTLAPNTAIDGLLGSQFRLKYKSSGTYAGGTSLTVDAVTGGRLEPW